MAQSLAMNSSIIQSALSTIWDTVGAELSLLVLFCAGFLLFRFAAIQRFFVLWPKSQQMKTKRGFNGHVADPQKVAMPLKELEANWGAGRSDLVLSSWRSIHYITCDAFKIIVEAAVAMYNKEPDKVAEVVEEVLRKHTKLCTEDTMTSILSVLPEDSTDIASSIQTLFLKRITQVSENCDDGQRYQNEVASGASKQSANDMLATIFNAKANAEWEQLAIETVRSHQLQEAAEEVIARHDAGNKISASCLLKLEQTSKSVGEASFLDYLPLEMFAVDVIVALLEHALKTGDSKLLRKTHQRARTSSKDQAPAVCEALLRAYAGLGDSRAVEVFDEIVKCFSPPDSVLTGVISLCAESRHVQMAEHLLTHIRRCERGASLSQYAAVMKVYTHSKLCAKTCDLFSMMQEDRVEPDTVVYGALIKAAVESGRLDLARNLFKVSGNPDVLNYMSLIRAAGREKDVPKSMALLEELENAPLAVDTPVYNCVMEVCVASGDSKAAADLLKRMEAKHQVDVVSYNTYLKLLFTTSAHHEIDAILHTMRARGLRPNAITYNSLVKDAVIRQDLDGAWILISEMEAEGVKPDSFTCSILMKGLRHSPSSNDVDKVVDLIHRIGFVPDEVLVNCLLDAYVRLRDIPRLVETLEQFKSSGVVPSLRACAILLKAYGHSRRLDRAWALWHELIGERKVAPNDEVCAAMVDACLAGSDVEGAISVFREMKPSTSEMSKAPSAFAGLIKVCISQKQTQLAVDICEEMKDTALIPHVATYNALLDALVRKDDMTAAVSLFRDMSLKGVSPDLITFATLIKGHCARGCLEQGLQLLGRMQRQGISPDAVVFNSILDGCAHKQMRTLTEQVLKDMEKAGIAPTNFTVSILVKLYGRCSDLDTAFNVVETFPELYKFKVNAQVYTCLMSACIANGALPRAMEVYDKMRAAGCKSDAKVYQTLLNGCIRYGDLDTAAQLVNDALSKNLARCLDQELVENVLFMISRRGRASDLGLPLLESMETYGIVVSQRICNAIRNCGAPQRTGRRPVQSAA